MNDDTPITPEDKLDYLTQQVASLKTLVLSLKEPGPKYVLTVEELANRWNLSPEGIRRLVRDKQIRPLREFRPFRFTLKDIRDFEDNDTPRLRGMERKGGRP